MVMKNGTFHVLVTRGVTGYFWRNEHDGKLRGYECSTKIAACKQAIDFAIVSNYSAIRLRGSCTSPKARDYCTDAIDVTVSKQAHISERIVDVHRIMRLAHDAQHEYGLKGAPLDARVRRLVRLCREAGIGKPGGLEGREGLEWIERTAMQWLAAYEAATSDQTRDAEQAILQ